MKLHIQLGIGFAALLALMVLMLAWMFFGTSLDGGTVLFGVAVAMAAAAGVMLNMWKQVFAQIGGEPTDIATAAHQIARGNLEVELQGDRGIAGSINGVAATLKEVTRQVNEIAGGNYSANIAPLSDKDELGAALQTMTAALRNAHLASTALDWLKSGLARLSDAISGDPTLETLATRAVSQIASTLDAQVGALYLAKEAEKPKLVLLGSYAYSKRKNLSNEFALGEGLVGQAALERQQILIRNVPEDYVRVTSGLGESLPRFICVTPIVYENRLKGVLEIGMLGEFSPVQMEYMTQAMPLLAITIESAQARDVQAQLLEEARRLTEELQTQQEELRTNNEELEQQSRRLTESEERLRVQQEELEVTNNELEQKNEMLQRQKVEVEQARQVVTLKADELALASKYKSEFLANMSHELRTPLNSLLLLAQSLAQNKSGNLTDDQVESARIIYSGGNDLLNLINEILDLSKIEAGRMELQISKVAVADMADAVRSSFAHMAQAKGLSLEVAINPDAPQELATDHKRVEQIIRNLLSNAIKFTETGSVIASFGRADKAGFADGLNISVKDTCIGIPAEKHKLIFEAFQQADGSTSRRFGGTGLGLTISRELAALLGGKIHLASEPGVGSTFTLVLPAAALQNPAQRTPDSKTALAHVRRSAAKSPTPAPGGAPPLRQSYIADDVGNIADTDKLIVVIEDDPKFATILLGKCHEKGFKCLAAADGESGLALIDKHLPAAVILDIHLPGMDGMMILSALKEDIRTRHIPVHMVSVDDSIGESMRLGAVGHAVKPLDQERLEDVFHRLEDVLALKPRRLLVVEDDPVARQKTLELLSDDDLTVDEAASGAEAIRLLRAEHYDCVVLDLKLPDMDGQSMLEQLERDGIELPPVVVHTARDLSAREEIGLREHAESIIVKGARSPERLLDEVTLFLHRVVSRMPEKKRRIIADLHGADAALRDKKVLIVDDDMRTMFAVSRLLTEHGMVALKAENGDRALQLLQEEPVIDLVLMDVMMPVMDGYEAMQRIRQIERYRKLPIIALTAKAMPEDRQKCITAGASDYLPKPIDPDRLFSMMRVWLHGAYGTSHGKETH